MCLPLAAGLWTKQQSLDDLAMVMARYQNEPGRDWRSLQDTHDQPIIQYNTPLAWRRLARSRTTMKWARSSG